MLNSSHKLDLGVTKLIRLVLFVFMDLCRYQTQSVALKLVQRNGTPEEVAKRESRFAREVTLLCRLQHKNLVKVAAEILSFGIQASI